MRYTEGGDSDWQIVAVEIDGACPFDIIRGAPAAERVAVYNALRLLQAAGIPPLERYKGNLNLQACGKHRPSGVRSKYQIYVVKTTPHPWRLYVCVTDRSQRFIEILHVVAKKQWKRDPNDFKRCCFVLDRIAAGATECRRIAIPGR